MNNVRRKNLAAIIERVQIARDLLDELYGEEEEYRDNIPENLQGSAVYEKADEAVDALYEALGQLDEAVSSIESAIGG